MTKLRVAITGGGLAGAAVARALLDQAHVHFELFESSPSFSERGMAIGLAVNAQKALKALVEDADQIFSRAGAVIMNSTRIMIGSGPQAGTKVIDVAEEYPGRMIHRAALLQELLAPIPKDRLHANKKLVSIQEISNELRLTFDDESTTYADALIGADGIFGSVRSHILAVDDPAVRPVPAGWAGAMNMVPYAKAETELGAVNFQENRQYGWVGKNGIFIHDTINNGKMVQCIGTSVDHSPSKDRMKPVDRAYLEAAFATWLDGPVAKPMINLLLEQENPAAYAQWEHVDAPTYVRGRTCIVGDAAHAMTPWQGSGAATALEDAVIIGALFRQINSSDQVHRALEVYDSVRRPRSQRIAESSRLTGRILSGMDEDVGIDPDKMHEALKDRWTFIHDFDIDTHVQAAVEQLHERID